MQRKRIISNCLETLAPLPLILEEFYKQDFFWYWETVFYVATGRFFESGF
jgi:hypothetical protein